jgi:hypothetical protein
MPPLLSLQISAQCDNGTCHLRVELTALELTNIVRKITFVKSVVSGFMELVIHDLGRPLGLDKPRSHQRKSN